MCEFESCPRQLSVCSSIIHCSALDVCICIALHVHAHVPRSLPHVKITKRNKHSVLSIHVLMRDEKEERKKRTRSNKQTRQSNTAHPTQLLSLRKMSMHMYM